MLAAAKHVAEMNFSQKKTEEYVRALRAKSGRPRAVRLTPGAFVSRVRRVRETLGATALTRRLGR